MISIVPETIAYMLLLFFFLSIGLFIGLASFAFSDPVVFAQWIPPMSFIFKKSSSRVSRAYSFGMGFVFLGFALAVSFLFGSLSTSFAMSLWTSPLIRWFEKWAN